MSFGDDTLDPSNVYKYTQADMNARDEEMAEKERQLAALKDSELGKKFTYCAYCGHTESVDVDGEVIAAHIRSCEKHPLNIQLAERVQIAVRDHANWHLLGHPDPPPDHWATEIAATGLAADRCNVCKKFNDELAERVREAVREELTNIQGFSSGPSNHTMSGRAYFVDVKWLLERIEELRAAASPVSQQEPK